MRPILRRRRPELDPAPAAPPDRTHLHLDQIQAVADRYACDHAPCISKRDQAAAEMAGWLAECGVDLDDPMQLHAALVALTAALVEEADRLTCPTCGRTIDPGQPTCLTGAGTIHRGCCLYQHDDDHTDVELVKEATRYLQGDRGTPRVWAMRGVGS